MVGHVSSLMVFKPSDDHPLNAEVVKRYMRERMHLLPPLRQRLVNVPFGIDLPYWRDDPDVDFDYHVRGIALPAGSGEKELKEFAARVVSRRLDRSHPLWEVYAIEGLEGGRVGILSKFHHAAIDGQSGVRMMTTLLSTDREDTLRPPSGNTEIVGDPEPTELEMLTRGWGGVLTKPGAGLRLAGESLRESVKTLRALGVGGVAGATRSFAPAPRLAFNATLTARRNWAYGTVDLEDVRKIKNQHDCTVNDVVMALCASALRAWLINHGELPDKPLVAMVPVSIRTPEQGDAMGNQVSGVMAELPTHLADPVERLHHVRNEMRAAKDAHNALPAHLLTDFSNFTAPVAAEFVARLATDMRWADRVSLPYNVAISNVPGPRETLWYAGCELEAIYPFSMIADGMGLNITLQSYRDGLHFGLVSTPELIPDLDQLIEHVYTATRELLAA